MDDNISRISFSKVRNFKEIFSAIKIFLQHNWKSFFGLIAIYAGPFFLLSGYYASNYTLEIINSQNAVFTQNSIFQLIFQIAGNVMLNGISFSYIIVYMRNLETNKTNVMLEFNKHIVTVIKATVVAELLLSLGFMMLIIPGLILIVPLNLYVFDKILHNQSFGDSIMRSYRLAQNDIKLSYGVLLSLFVAILLITQLFGSLLSHTSESFIMSHTILNGFIQILGGIINVGVVLLYFSLKPNQQ